MTVKITLHEPAVEDSRKIGIHMFLKAQKVNTSSGILPRASGAQHHLQELELDCLGKQSKPFTRGISATLMMKISSTAHPRAPGHLVPLVVNIFRKPIQVSFHFIFIEEVKFLRLFFQRILQLSLSNNALWWYQGKSDIS